MEQLCDTKKNDNRTCSINPVTALSNMKNLEVPYGCEWGVFTTVLNISANKKGSKNPDFFGYVIPLGSFKTKEKAEKNVKKIMEKTGCQTVSVCKYGSFFPMGLKSFEKSRKKDINFDIRGKIMDMESEYDNEIKNYFKKQQEKEEEYNKKTQLEKDTNSLEYIKMQYYFLLTNAINISKLEKEKKEIEGQFNIRKNNIQEFIKNNPDCGESWWKLLEDDFSDNIPLLEVLKSKYEELKNNL